MAFRMPQASTAFALDPSDKAQGRIEDKAIPTDRRFMDLRGRRYGRLVVVAYEGRPKPSRHQWLCKCDCGNDFRATGGDLQGGDVHSCGCLRKEMMAAKQSTHNGTDTREYSSWLSMRTRCLNPNNHKYPRYGGRGIAICERWNDFANFLADMGPRPADTTLDRYPDNDGNYEPGNCRWATATEQQHHIRGRKRGHH